MKTKSLLSIAFVLTMVGIALGQRPMVEQYLMSGQLKQGNKQLAKYLTENPDDDQVRFGLGVLQFMQAAEHLGKAWYSYGINEDMRRAAFIRFPVPDNANPQQVTYQDFRNVFKQIIVHLDESDQTLSRIQSKDVKLPLQIFKFHIDFDGDGKISPNEDMQDVYGEYFGVQFQNAKMQNASITFDYSDVEWLRGYSNVIRAMCEFILAYDHEPFWNVIAYRVFAKPEFKYDFLEEEYKELAEDGFDGFDWWDRNAVLDAIAAIHNLNFKLVEPERLKSAHQHLKQTVVHSRKMWESVLAETDDDHEWIPNPDQTSVVSMTQITDRMVTTWKKFLDEVDDILDGKKLIPFWRGNDDSRGVNLRKCFLRPRDLDIVLWVHGTGAAPFLEKGKISQAGTWREFEQVYGGQFFSFAAWFN